MRDPGLDLAVAAAILGEAWGVAVRADSVAIGEVGLRGEVRGVGLMTARLKEARAMGFLRAFVPQGTPRLDGIETTEIGRVDEMLREEHES